MIADCGILRIKKIPTNEKRPTDFKIISVGRFLIRWAWLLTF
jgi:hypothetical protein